MNTSKKATTRKKKAPAQVEPTPLFHNSLPILDLEVRENRLGVCFDARAVDPALKSLPCFGAGGAELWVWGRRAQLEEFLAQHQTASELEVTISPEGDATLAGLSSAPRTIGDLLKARTAAETSAPRSWMSRRVG